MNNVDLIVKIVWILQHSKHAISNQLIVNKVRVNIVMHVGEQNFQMQRTYEQLLSGESIRQITVMLYIFQLFEKKPLYLKVEIETVSGIPGMKLKFYLPAMCFYWLDGPWRGQWNRFGYNPTTIPEAKIYQTVDFRFRQCKFGMLYLEHC